MKKNGIKRRQSYRLIEIKDVYHSFAYRVYIQGKQNGPKESNPQKHALIDAFDDAQCYLSKTLKDQTKLTESDKARRINSWICVKVGSEFEKRLSSNFRSALSSYGEIVACDEKVFEFDSPTSGFFRKIPNKGQKGLWNYTMCVTLSPNIPFLIYSRCATEISNLDQHITMVGLMQEQIDVVREKPVARGHYPCIVYDSFYGTVAGLQLCRKLRQPFIWALNPQRFGSIVELVSDSVRKTGDMAFAVRAKDDAKELEELLTCFWSPDSKKGKRFTITNYLKRANHKKRKGYIPGFMEYEYSFSGCDSYNRRLHDKSWCHRYGAGKYSVEMQAGHNFLFTCALVNCHHLWKSLDFENRKKVSFQEFTTDLAVEIVRKDWSGYGL